jgi:hypothetical protein
VAENQVGDDRSNRIAAMTYGLEHYDKTARSGASLSFRAIIYGLIEKRSIKFPQKQRNPTTILQMFSFLVSGSKCCDANDALRLASKGISIG